MHPVYGDKSFMIYKFRVKKFVHDHGNLLMRSDFAVLLQQWPMQWSLQWILLQALQWAQRDRRNKCLNEFRGYVGKWNINSGDVNTGLLVEQVHFSRNAQCCLTASHERQLASKIPHWLDNVLNISDVRMKTSSTWKFQSMSPVKLLIKMYISIFSQFPQLTEWHRFVDFYGMIL